MMAPFPGTPSAPQKRSLSMADTDPRPPKKLRRSYQRHHAPQYMPQVIPESEPAIIQQQSLDKLLLDSVKTVCEEQAARMDIDEPAIESIALESLTSAVEEFITKICNTVRRSMLSGRRTVPIPSDFETAITLLDLPWPFDQLEPYITKPSINKPLLPTPPPEDVFHHDVHLPVSFLGPGLDGREDKERDLYIPSNFPAFPSKHTYKTTAVFSARETDARRIRELAAEEGKLGEEALRKLAGAIKAENTISIDPDPREKTTSNSQKKKGKEKDMMEAVFEETMKELMKEENTTGKAKFELGPTVNCERQYWMKYANPGKRKAVDTARPTEGLPGTSGTGGTGIKLSFKARGKQKAVETNWEADADMELYETT